ncbi:MAG: ATP-binding protein [Thalassobaculaceae bacterium]|uniref:ATP-binding protein n=1 Tax=Roseitalea porphyridii TaxID=1852022 RepID=UPI0032ECC4A9
MMSARSFGNYNLAAALADLIDNSINAGAGTISLRCVRGDGDPEVKISDDGHGMSAETLRDAMRPATRDPREERAPDDLGRFGWGMKTASFSQCLVLTVISSDGKGLTGARWDLENLDGWRMEVLSEDTCRELCSPSLTQGTGTEVIWSRCDRLSEDGTVSQDEFNRMVAGAREQLALVFHRFIDGSDGARRINISFNGTPLDRFDPFMRSHSATQSLDEEILPIREGGVIRVRPYILPHFGKVAAADHNRLQGSQGMIRNQGFYVYRANRLIIHGTWFRLIRHGELSQLVRISVDIPNSLDREWKITVDKSDAQPPQFLRERLRAVVQKLVSVGIRPYRRTPRRTGRQSDMAVWHRSMSGGSIVYRINRDHPFIKGLSRNPGDGRSLASVLGMIEQSVPIAQIQQEQQNREDRIVAGETNASSFREYVRDSAPALLALAGGDIREFRRILGETEPFASNMTVTEEVLGEMGWLGDGV